MYIVIDKKKMVFLPIKHTILEVVCNLVWIEAPQAHAHVLPLDHRFMSGYTDLEMMLLYKNTTGQAATCYGDRLRNVLYDIGDRIAAREVNRFEVETQASLVPAQSKKSYRYLPGAFKPIEKGQLFDLEPIKMTRAENESLIAARPRIRAPAHVTPAPATTLAPQAQNRPAALPAAPKQGGIRELIWAVADKMWSAINSPKDQKVVLNLRKEVMNVLEKEHGVKRTSSSNELGNWMKSRI